LTLLSAGRARAFKYALKAVDVLLFVTPEYNCLIEERYRLGEPTLWHQ